MARKRVGHRDKGELEMTPMIDVTFLLLIFFMCATKFKVFEGKLLAQLPKDKGMSSQQQKIDPIRPVDILISSSGGEPSIFVGENPVADFKTLVKRLVEVRDTVGETVPININGKSDVPFQWVISALNACMEAGLTEVTFTPPNPEDLEG